MPATTAPRTRGQHARLVSDLRLACMRISRRVRYESEDDLAPHLFSVLVRVEEGPRTPRELAAIERVSAPSMSRALASLVARGLVARTDDPSDGRQVILSITPGGRRTVREMRRRRDEWFAARLADLDEEEREVLRRAADLLTRVAAG